MDRSYRIQEGGGRGPRLERVVAAYGHDDFGNCQQERMEKGQHPQDSEQIENGVGAGGPSGGYIRHGSRYVGGDSGSDVFPQYQGCGHFEWDPAVVDHYQGEGHGRAGRLQHDGQYGADHYENDYRKEPEIGPFLKKSQHFGRLLEIG